MAAKRMWKDKKIVWKGKEQLRDVNGVLKTYDHDWKSVSATDNLQTYTNSWKAEGKAGEVYEDYFTTHKLTINYKSGDTVVAPKHEDDIAVGIAYSVNSPVVEGYVITNPAQSVISGTMSTSDVTVNVGYTATHTLTINYKSGDTVVSDAHVEVLAEGATYSVVSPTVEGYTLTDPTQATIAGTMSTADVTVNVAYTADTEEE